MEQQTPLEDTPKSWRMHFDARLDRLESTIASGFAEVMENTNQGFPNGDAASHRKVHEGYIRSAESKQKIIHEVVTHSLKGIVWAALVFLGLAIWNQIKGGLH